MNPSISRTTGRTAGRAPAVALFGGVFNPIHTGHLAVARAACRRFRLDRIYFVPSGHPPHKPAAAITAFEHRYAMVSLACAGDKRFVPSPMEASTTGADRIFYTIDTVQSFRSKLAGKATRLYFIVGADAFLQIGTWKNYRRLLHACEFIVANRPGFRLDGQPGRGARVPAGATVHLLRTVSSDVSSTEIRQRRKQGRSIRGLVPPLVEEYIAKQALYCE